MFSENLKMLRKKKGMSQEMLAGQLHVVRQTISKWEKGLSVPDAEMLTRIAELFEVPVSQLLGAKMEEEKDVNEISAQLALLNEQLAVRNRRNKKILKTIVGIVLGLFAVMILVTVILFVSYASRRTVSEANQTTIELICTLEGEEYRYGITFDDQYNIIEAGGSAFIADHVETEKYDDANILIAQIEDYFSEHGGSCERVEDSK